MDINITGFFYGAAPRDYSKSQMEAGPTAGPDGWNAAVEDASDYGPMLSTPDQLEAMREHVRGFGAWDDEEIDTYSHQMLNALLIQCIASDMRDYCDDVEQWDWSEYEAGCEAGTYSGNIARGVEPGTVYYYIGE